MLVITVNNVSEQTVNYVPGLYILATLPYSRAFDERVKIINEKIKSDYEHALEAAKSRANE